jgi:hypothetical protein
MSRGYPDDNIQEFPLGQTIADNAELAARLGALNTLQRSGSTIYKTDFKDGAGDWYLSVVSGGSSKVRANIGIVSPSSLELDPGSSGSDEAWVIKVMPLIDYTKLGWEFLLSFFRAVPVYDPEINLSANVAVGSEMYYFAWHILPLQEKVVIDSYTPPATLVPYEIPLGYNLFPDSGHYLFHYFKLFIDIGKARFDHIIVDSQAFSLLNCLPRITSVGFTPSVQLTTRYPYVADALPCYIGTTILTINEP